MTPVKLLLVLLLSASPLLAQSSPKLNDLSVANAIGGQPIFDLVKNAKTVTAQRIDSKLAETAELAEKHPEIIVLGEPFKLNDADAAEIRKAFTTSATYISPSKSCVFRANVRYGFVKSPEEKVEFVLCFGCGELEVWHKGEMVSFGPFDGGYANLLDITKRLFPKDEFLAKFDARIFEQRANRLREATPTP